MLHLTWLKITFIRQCQPHRRCYLWSRPHTTHMAATTVVVKNLILSGPSARRWQRSRAPQRWPCWPSPKPASFVLILQCVLSRRYYPLHYMCDSSYELVTDARHVHRRRRASRPQSDCATTRQQDNSEHRRFSSATTRQPCASIQALIKERFQARLLKRGLIVLRPSTSPSKFSS